MECPELSMAGLKIESAPERKVYGYSFVDESANERSIKTQVGSQNCETVYERSFTQNSEVRMTRLKNVSIGYL
jgi:hypothetical protein